VDSTKTSIPAARSWRNPFPETLGFGSSKGATTLEIPARIMTSVQGGATP